MPFKKGQSGNPSGRTPGTENKTTRALKEAMLAVFDELGGVTHLKTWAGKFPTEYYKLLLRFAPPGATVRIEGLTGALADQGRVVVERMAAGEITPEQASTIMQTIASQARIIEVDELERRIAVLEKKNGA